MSKIVNDNFEFNDISNVLDFVKPLLIEGYSVSINRIRNTYVYCEEDKFTVIVGNKGCKWQIYGPDEEKACVEE